MLAIIVPYRDRKDHIDQFIPHMNKFLSSAKIVIVEQTDEKPFNRGRLLNIGFKETISDFYCFHDVDMLPLYCDYGDFVGVNQLARSEIQKVDYLGGATLFDRHTFIRSGGYHNDYFHRAEDNEMMFNLKRLKIPVNQQYAHFHQLHHPRTSPEFIPELWVKAQLTRTENMLNTCKYELISKEVYNSHTYIKVAL